MPTYPAVFVSHSHRDNDYCRAFVKFLRKAGVDVWYDEDNLTDSELLRKIQPEIYHRPIFVVILSEAALYESNWVNTESLWAYERFMRDRVHRRILPVVGAPLTNKDFGENWMFLQGMRHTGRSDVMPFPPKEAAQDVLAAMSQVEEAEHIEPPFAQAASMPASTHISLPRVSPSFTSPSTPTLSVIAPDHFPQRLASLGYTRQVINGVEVIRPPLCDVPAGPFKMGSDQQYDRKAFKNELPQHVVKTQAYQIARYSVTVAEYACYLRATPATERRLVRWQSQPDQMDHLDHPVVDVDWNAASDYVAWLAQITGQPWRLPTEAEWEKAARGSDGRIYPWGNRWDTTRANTNHAGPKHATPVGSYPGGASPYGAEDMAGNVWEWTSSLYAPYSIDSIDSIDSITSNTIYIRPFVMVDRGAVLRGGSWADDPEVARVACRLNSKGDLLRTSPNAVHTGFRIAQSHRVKK